MFQTIIVDDELASMRRFERIAASDDRISLEGRFQYAQDALNYAKEAQIDVAFIDIEMPEINGLELAKQLMEIDPQIKVIFLTAYSQYALEAYRTHAIGYLLKPLDEKDLRSQIDLLALRFGPRTMTRSSSVLNLTCFGRFTVLNQAGEALAIRWKTAKTEELFLLLVYYQGRAKPKELIIDALWPELEGDKSSNLFRVTCSYLRSALAEQGIFDLLLRDWDGYKLNTDLLSCDLFELRAGIRNCTSLSLQELERLSERYKGSFLEEKPYEWSQGTRLQMENGIKKVLFLQAEEYRRLSRWSDLEHVLERVIVINPYEEEAIKKLMQLHLQQGNFAKAKLIYTQFDARMRKDLQMTPSFSIKDYVS